MTVYHVSVPSTLVYYVEAKDEDDARERVAAAIAGTPVDPAACWIMGDRTEQSPPTQWDVEHEDACSGCGNPIDQDWGVCPCGG
jgi:hypothetical protein